MILCFKLTMPNVGSWNGRWTGERDLHAKTINMGRSKDAILRAKEILDIGSFWYDFGDGWAAGISVTKVDAREAGRIRRKSKGFFGYEWMIQSIRENLKIEARGNE